MSLFKTSELSDLKQQVKESSVIDDPSPENFVVVKSKADIDRIISTINERNLLVHYCTAGAFSAHELLFSILSLTGPAKVYLTTWTMTEYPARLLTEALNKGLIKELYCVMDVRMEKNPGVLQLISQNSTQIRLSQCHAKAMIIEAEKHSISVISSQNMTENPRLEAGTITTDPDVMQFHKNWILSEIENGHGFE